MKIEKKDLFEFSKFLLLLSGILLALAFGLFGITTMQAEVYKFILTEKSYEFKTLDTFKYFVDIIQTRYLPFIVLAGVFPTIFLLFRCYDRFKSFASNRTPPKNLLNDSIFYNILIFLLEILVAIIIFLLAYIYSQQGYAYIDMLLNKFL
jgi:hypothetical protein